jgi:hypothetical protein
MPKGKKLSKTPARGELHARDQSQPQASVDGQPVADPQLFKTQQAVLDVFKSAAADDLGDSLQPLLQEVKQHLFNRDFLQAFGRDDYLGAYSARWSPSRALGYSRRNHLWKILLEDVPWKI